MIRRADDISPYHFNRKRCMPVLIAFLVAVAAVITAIAITGIYLSTWLLAIILQSYLLIWLFGLMGAVLAACLLYLAGAKLIDVVNHWRFLNWLNQSRR